MPAFGKKNISEDEESDDMGSSSKQTTNKKTTVKKRKRVNTKEEDIAESSVVPTSPNELEKKKLKKEKKTKQKATPKKKAPLDLDRQCGVLIAPNNNPCTRSLTCKIHAMGAKRAVEGRSQPFNELLAAYQKKGIGRPQVPGGSSSVNATNDVSTSTNTPSTKTIHNNTSNTKKGNDISIPAAVSSKDEDIDIDSDEETESVRMAIEQNKPIPLGTKKIFYVRRKRKYYKLRDILLEAITPKQNNTLSTEIPLNF